MGTKKKSIFESKKFKESMKFVYGFGGAIVIIGAMFKITHWPGATEMLVAGLTTEALIFIISSFEPLHEDPDWSKVHPELAETDEDDEDDEHENRVTTTKTVNKTAGLNDIFASANIDPSVISRFGEGMKAIAHQAESLGNLAPLSDSAQRFTTNLDKASQQIEGITTSSLTLSQTLEQAKNMNFSGLNENMQALNENIQQVNQIYDKQVKGMNDGFTVSNQVQDHLRQALESLQLVADNASLYQQNIQTLSQNIQRINQVYEQVLAQVESELPEKRKGIFEKLFDFFSGK